MYALGALDVQRWNAQDCADCALIGPLTRDMVVKELNAKQGISNDIVHGRLDSWHALVKVLEHSDRLEEDPSKGFVSLYYKLTQELPSGGYFWPRTEDLQGRCKTAQRKMEATGRSTGGWDKDKAL